MSSYYFVRKIIVWQTFKLPNNSAGNKAILCNVSGEIFMKRHCVNNLKPTQTVYVLAAVVFLQWFLYIYYLYIYIIICN